MKTLLMVCALVVLLGCLAACGPVATPVSTCEITALTDTNAYFRPSLAADKFGTVSAGTKLTILGRTADNWYAFDPGVAQAGNVGIFRNRWVQASASLSISPTCANLATIYTRVPQAGVCYVMAMESVPVRASPNASAAVIYTLTVGDYAQGMGKAGTWIKIDLASGSVSGVTQQGWVSEAQIGLSGCGSLPTITP